jgi:hypothetical protein
MNLTEAKRIQDVDRGALMPALSAPDETGIMSGLRTSRPIVAERSGIKQVLAQIEQVAPRERPPAA